jgi:dsDNA-specific endonuclease/ATPase MutS2
VSFKVGDKVRFLNADGYGTIISILDLSRAEVKNEHGFEEVLYLKELVLEGAQEDYQTDGSLFNDEIKNKLRADKNTNSGTDLNKKLNQLNKFTPNQRLIIDLHIEKLIDSHSGMSNFQILNIQMSHFKSFLSSAIAKKTRKVVVIHGVGEGVLRHEIRKVLDIYHPNFEFQDASYEEFGYGATEIRITN